ncbi:MAG: DUF3006 domain-containing protein [Candidatus Rokuibacteriota bacterium]
MTYFVVDRMEGSIAVVIADDGRSFEVPRKVLPKGSGEGTVLRVEGEGVPDWSSAVIDAAERQRRLERARETLRRLGEADSGGDVQL